LDNQGSASEFFMLDADGNDFSWLSYKKQSIYSIWAASMVDYLLASKF
jgi:hypothetical protein